MIPELFVIPDPLAVRADRDDAPQIHQLADVFQNKQGVGFVLIGERGCGDQNIILGQAPSTTVS
jgi:hypothetical protein